MKIRKSILCVLTLLAFGCKQRTFNAALMDTGGHSAKSTGADPVNFGPNSVDTAHPALNAAGEKLWSEYIAKISFDTLQEGCRPARFHVPSGTRKGVVFLYHGFTACPQQFYDWAEKLASAGFEVFIPLLPGHGVKRDGAGQEMSQAMPDLKNYKTIWPNFVTTINAIAKNSNGERVIGGLSLGGALATASIWEGQNRQANADNIYTRAILMAPMYAIGDGGANLAAGFLDNLAKLGLNFQDQVGDQVTGWGPDCVQSLDRKTPPGPRGGYCTFKAKHGLAMAKFGFEISDDIDQVKIPVQIVGVRDDKAVKSDRIRFVAAKMAFGAIRGSMDTSGDRSMDGSTRTADTDFDDIESASEGSSFKVSNVRICFFGPPVPHSMLSKFDAPDLPWAFNPSKPKPWLPALLQNATKFVTQGTYFQALAMTVGEGEDRPMCPPSQKQLKDLINANTPAQ